MFDDAEKSQTFADGNLENRNVEREAVLEIDIKDNTLWTEKKGISNYPPFNAPGLSPGLHLYLSRSSFFI